MAARQYRITLDPHLVPFVLRYGQNIQCDDLSKIVNFLLNQLCYQESLQGGQISLSLLAASSTTTPLEEPMNEEDKELTALDEFTL